MSYEFTCYSCGVRFMRDGGNGKCPTCIQTDIIQRGQQQAQEAADQAHREQMRQHEELQRHNEMMYYMQSQHQEMLNGEARKQTQLLLEANIGDDEAYQNGYSWENNMPGTTISHNTYISVDDDGEMSITTLTPGFLTPRLYKQYRDGFIERFWDERVSLGKDYIDAVCRGCGQQAKAEFTPGYQFPNTEVWARYQPINTKLAFSTNQTTGEIDATLDWSVFRSQSQSDAYKEGLEQYLSTVNTPEQNKIRLDEIKEQQRLQEEAERKERGEETFYTLLKILAWTVTITFVVWLFN